MPDLLTAFRIFWLRLEFDIERFFSNLVVNKRIKGKRKFSRQSVSQSFETFLCFKSFYFHHKWNDGRLLLINIVYTSCLWSCLTRCQMTRFRISGNIRKLSKRHRMMPSAQSPHKNEIFVNSSRILLKNRNEKLFILF